MYDFLADLDGYFCEKYANYDKLCILPNYVMPVMQRSEVRADGRTYAYTLPASTMRLATQAKKDDLLKELKTRMTDTTFSFSFVPYGFFTRIGNIFAKMTFKKALKIILAKYGVPESEAFSHLDISEEIWTGICKGKFAPSKNLIYSLALTAQISYEDTCALMALCGYEFDFAVVKDVVVSYLLTSKVYNRGMIDAAFAEYKVCNLFIK
ncbi:MAG: hypothetical protein IKZ28_05775 [Clostridia bacterium]|nr:hypothetical protein [Clostridia bacterium]